MLQWYSMPPHDSMLSRYSMYNLYNHLWFAVQPFIVHCLLLLVCLWHHYCCPFMKRKVFSWPWLRNVTHPSLANQENIPLECKQRRDLSLAFRASIKIQCYWMNFSSKNSHDRKLKYMYVFQLVIMPLTFDLWLTCTVYS